MNRKTQTTTGVPENSSQNHSQKTENADGRGNGFGIDFEKLVTEAHERQEEKEKNNTTVEGNEPSITDQEEEKAYKPYQVLPKGMVKQLAAFPFAGIENVFRPFYPEMQSMYLTENEAEELAAPLDLVLWEYSPYLLSQYGALFALGFSMMMMVIRKAGWSMAPKQILTVPDEEKTPEDAAGFEESSVNAS